MAETPLTALRLLTADDLAARWSVDRSLIYKLTRRGSLPAVRLGRVVRYRIEAVEAFEDAGGTSGESK